jgi:chitin disaccharide deacetylase
MLIINADDLGRCEAATDRIMACVTANRVTAASAMVFMADSERAAELARRSGLDIGLHINFTEEFSGKSVPPELRNEQQRVSKFLRRSKYALLMYNPLLRHSFRKVFYAQLVEFERLYGSNPVRVDGHQHMHLCSNVLIDRLLPPGTQVRRNFSFSTGEKNLVNRTYRNAVDSTLRRRHRLTDYFFALSQHLQIKRLARVTMAAQQANVELMCHPEVDNEYRFLLSDEFANAIENVELGNFVSQEQVHYAESLS